MWSYCCHKTHNNILIFFICFIINFNIFTTNLVENNRNLIFFNVDGSQQKLWIREKFLHSLPLNT
jgi:hypothetical protein